MGAIECDQTRANPADRQILPLAATSMLTGSPSPNSHVKEQAREFHALLYYHMYMVMQL